ncbi:hypothetical protein [Methylobacter tundripaludum]|uniref:hypothetical protein n=1 Tax=Methylobacter tundripaludum TaxID=173365 RepID=UPI0012697D51|nr:hypothetical protein [Methylobacter tundripaludum]
MTDGQLRSAASVAATVSLVRSLWQEGQPGAGAFYALRRHAWIIRVVLTGGAGVTGALRCCGGGWREIGHRCSHRQGKRNR